MAVERRVEAEGRNIVKSTVGCSSSEQRKAWVERNRTAGRRKERGWSGQLNEKRTTRVEGKEKKGKSPRASSSVFYSAFGGAPVPHSRN